MVGRERRVGSDKSATTAVVAAAVILGLRALAREHGLGAARTFLSEAGLSEAGVGEAPLGDGGPSDGGPAGAPPSDAVVSGAASSGTGPSSTKPTHTGAEEAS